MPQTLLANAKFALSQITKCNGKCAICNKLHVYDDGMFSCKIVYRAGYISYDNSLSGLRDNTKSYLEIELMDVSL